MSRPLDPRKIELLDDAMVEVLRTKTPAERLAMAFDCNRTMRLRLAGHLRTRHPDWTEEQIQAGVAMRVLEDSNTDLECLRPWAEQLGFTDIGEAILAQIKRAGENAKTIMSCDLSR